jgi:hypothetical protein
MNKKMNFDLTEWFENLDPKKLIDLTNFEFLINNKSCENLAQKPSVVIAIHSAPRNIERRIAIRETWGQLSRESLIIFMLGAVPEKIQLEIELENKVYGDIEQGNFIDSYRNMTYKHAMVFKWFLESCRNVKYLLKTDDDVFINTPLLYEYLKEEDRTIQQISTRLISFCVMKIITQRRTEMITNGK